jgi:apolipoprotein N-acyltransferase
MRPRLGSGRHAVAWYAKRHLVPFGERVAVPALVPVLGQWDLGQAEWRPGTANGLLPDRSARGFRWRCSSASSPSSRISRARTCAPARVLVNITNDEWFGNGAALQQHAAMAPFRAVEHRVPLLRCANTGVTAVIDAWGVVTAACPCSNRACSSPRMPAAGPRTPYTALGDWPGGSRARASRWRCPVAAHQR